MQVMAFLSMECPSNSQPYLLMPAVGIMPPSLVVTGPQKDAVQQTHRMIHFMKSCMDK